MHYWAEQLLETCLALALALALGWVGQDIESEHEVWSGLRSG